MTDKDQLALDHIRQRSAEYGCRIEVCSDAGDMPVSASNNDRTRYGFGRTIAEAVGALRGNPRKVT